MLTSGNSIYVWLYSVTMRMYSINVKRHFKWNIIQIFFSNQDSNNIISIFFNFKTINSNWYLVVFNSLRIDTKLKATYHYRLNICIKFTFYKHFIIFLYKLPHSTGYFSGWRTKCAEVMPSCTGFTLLKLLHFKLCQCIDTKFNLTKLEKLTSER